MRNLICAGCIIVKYVSRCSLCGKTFAVLNSAWHVTGAYRLKFCRKCTDELLIEVQRLKKDKYIAKP